MPESQYSLVPCLIGQQKLQIIPQLMQNIFWFTPDRQSCYCEIPKELTEIFSQVREYEFDSAMQDLQEKSAEKLKKDVESKRSQLEQWSSTAYGEVSILDIVYIQITLLF